MKIQLPMALDVPLTSLQSYRDFCGILVGQGYDIRGILYNNIITLLFGIDLYTLISVKGIKAYFLRKQLKRELPDYIQAHSLDFIKSAIDTNKYVKVILNSKFMSNVRSNDDWLHPWFIYGYDDEQNQLFASGFSISIEDKSVFRYQMVSISYEDYLLATNINYKEYKQDNNIFFREHFLEFYSIPNNYFPEPINLKKIRKDVFLYAYNILPFLFNARIYKKYARIFRKIHQKSKEPFDLRPLKALQEHKQILLKMMADLSPNGDAVKEYQIILDYTSKIMILALKYNISEQNKQNIIDSICDLFNLLYIKEPRVMRQFYHELKSLTIIKQI